MKRMLCIETKIYNAMNDVIYAGQIYEVEQHPEKEKVFIVTMPDGSRATFDKKRFTPACALAQILWDKGNGR